MSHRGLSERAEVEELTDEQLLERVVESCHRLREAKAERDRAIVDAMIRGINQTVIAQTAGVTRRALFQISDREWDRRQAEGNDRGR